MTASAGRRDSWQDQWARPLFWDELGDAMWSIRLTYPNGLIRWATSQGEVAERKDAAVFQSDEDAEFWLSRNPVPKYVAAEIVRN